MSAIFGIWDLKGKCALQSSAAIMKKALFQYGMDALDIYLDGNIAVGCCLNKTGVSAQNEIPVYLEPNSERVLVADALIYNRDELIEDHNLADNASCANSALLAAAYEKWGPDCPKHINGDFTFAIWEKGKLVLCRDHLGVRPLYYYRNEDVFIFATDYRAILALPFVSRRIDEKTLYDLLINNNTLHIEDTFFAGIKKLLPAHTLSVDEKSMSYKKYWTPGAEKKIIYDTEKEYAKALYEMVLNAVQCRVSHMDTKIGAELSGGLDSSVIDILATRELAKGRKELSMLFSWAPSFEAFGQQERDERRFSEELCLREGFDCLHFDMAKALDTLNLDTVTAVEEMPASPIRQACECAASNDIRFMLSGWGGDQGISHRAGLFELFVAGDWWHYFKEVRYISKGSVFKIVKTILSSTLLRLPRPYNFLYVMNYSDNIANKGFNRDNKKYRKKTIVYLGINPVKHLESGNIQTRTELTAMIGAEYNVQYLFPFLDPDVVDFAMSIPRHLYYKNGISRYIFRKAFEKILPNDLCYYAPKDDIARCSYTRDKLKEKNIEAELLEKRLSKNIFAKYIDFNRAKACLNRLRDNGDQQKENLLRKQLITVHNVQKLIERSEAKN